jgi:hypothetical protein
MRGVIDMAWPAGCPDFLRRWKAYIASLRFFDIFCSLILDQHNRMCSLGGHANIKNIAQPITQFVGKTARALTLKTIILLAQKIEKPDP